MRNETIKKANEKMWEEQDRVKALRSKMLMSDVLAERKEQEKLKRRKQQFQDAIDKEWDEQERQRLADQDEKHRKELEDQYNQKMETAKVIKDQLHDFKLRYVR